jgi:hypothetical protein
MKSRILATFCTIACAAIATAEVPSLINYQGRLTNANGDPVTGSKNFAISIYDAATNGTLLYTETIGAVPLDENGVYSFQFGGSGTSNTLVTETVATTNGTSTTFQKVLDNSPIVANSVSVSDGTYTWNQSAGSSNEDQFGVAYSTSLRRVTVNYYNGAPAAGRTITATYRYGTNGITGALSSGAEHWMSISVDGTTQGARQRVLAVPFAQSSANALRAAIADSMPPKPITFSVNYYRNLIGTTPSEGIMPYGFENVPRQQAGSGGARIHLIPSSIQSISSIVCDSVNSRNTGRDSSAGNYDYRGITELSLCSLNKSGAETTLAFQKRDGTSGEISLIGPFALDHSLFTYYIKMNSYSVQQQQYINIYTDFNMSAKISNIEIIGHQN